MLLAFGKQSAPKKNSLQIGVLISLVLASLLLAACGDSSPTARPTVGPTATPQAAPPLAYLAEVTFSFADQAEKAQRDLTTAQPGFPAYASWSEGNRWFVLARDSNTDRLRDVAGKDARIFPVTFLAEAQAGLSQVSNYPAYQLILNRTTVDVKAGGIKEAAQLIYGRAVNQLNLRNGLLIFTVADDQIYVLVPASAGPEQVMALASLGKLELVGTGTKNLADGTITLTSTSPALSDLKPKDATTYQTLAANNDFAALRAAGGQEGTRPALSFELRSGAKVFEYSRANIGKFMALVFDRQVISSASIGSAIKDRGEIVVPRWASPGGQADLQRFVELVNANPPQIFEAKEAPRTTSLVVSGSFTR